MDALWGEDPPPRASASLQSYVSNLRRLLEPGRPARSAPEVLVTRPPGYALVVPGTDVTAFCERLAAGQAAFAEGRWDDAAEHAAGGLALWRGEPLAGVPGPRLPMAPQRVELLDRVMYDFPDLTLVTRHGCEPWQDLAVKLMLKWPGLHYSTSAFAPKHYPKAIIDYANTRGADKIIYAGYYPMGLSLERIVTEMHESAAWQDELEAKGWTDAFLTGDEFDAFLEENISEVTGTLENIGLI